MSGRDDFAEGLGPDQELEAAPAAGAGGVDIDDYLPDTISDPGAEGGVDAPNEGDEKPETDL